MRMILLSVLLATTIKLSGQTPEQPGTIYVSRDHGASWSRSDTGFPLQDHINAWVFSKDYIFAGTDTHGVMISSDKGKSWSKSQKGLPFGVRVTALIAREGSIFAGTFQHGIYVSSNEGSSWHVFNDGIRNVTIRTFHETPYGLYVGTNDGIYVLAKNNDKWVKIGGEYQVNDFASDNKYVYAATHQGVERTPDGGLHWENVYHGGISKVTTQGNRVCLLDYFGAVYYANPTQMVWFKDEKYFPVKHSYQLTPTSPKILIPTPGLNNIMTITPASGLPPNLPLNNLLETPFGVFASSASMEGC